MSDFIRGGQVTFHNFRMLMQVVKVLAKICIFILRMFAELCHMKIISQILVDLGNKYPAEK